MNNNIVNAYNKGYAVAATARNQYERENEQLRADIEKLEEKLDQLEEEKEQLLEMFDAAEMRNCTLLVKIDKLEAELAKK